MGVNAFHFCLFSSLITRDLFVCCAIESSIESIMPIEHESCEDDFYIDF